MLSAYLKLEGDTTGKIRGPVRDRDSDKDGSISLLAVEHGIVSPRDAATGLATGKRQHQPITLTKETDNTSPLFYQFISRNELIKTAEILFFGHVSTGLSAGREAIQYKITLRKASVSRVELVGHTDAAANQAIDRFPLREKISLVYDSIHWEWINPNAAAEDFFKSTT